MQNRCENCGSERQVQDFKNLDDESVRMRLPSALPCRRRRAAPSKAAKSSTYPRVPLALASNASLPPSVPLRLPPATPYLTFQKAHTHCTHTCHMMRCGRRRATSVRSLSRRVAPSMVLSELSLSLSLLAPSCLLSLRVPDLAAARGRSCTPRSLFPATAPRPTEPISPRPTEYIYLQYCMRCK